MPCIDSCVSLGRMLDCEVEILWYVNSQLYCPFQQLFELPDGVNLVEVDTWFDLKRRITDFNATHVMNPTFFRDVNPDHSFWRDTIFYPSDRLFITGNRRFLVPRYGHTHLRPSESVLAKISENLHLVDGSLGVHVRRTDHKKSIFGSPTESYFSLLDARPTEERFFLSTDDEAEETAFRDRYGSRVVNYTKRSRNRSESIAIEDALIDMMLLSRCTAIVAPVGSTFSSCAAFMGNLLLHRVVR